MSVMEEPNVTWMNERGRSPAGASIVALGEEGVVYFKVESKQGVGKSRWKERGPYSLVMYG